MTNAHIPRERGPEDSGRYGAYGGFTEARHKRVKWVRIYHPIYDPEPEKPTIWATFLAAVMALFTGP